MKVNEFYTKVIKSFKLDVTSDGFIKHGNKSIVIDGKPLVLPVKEQLQHLTEPDEMGQYKPIKVLFNPLKENLVKKDSDVIKKLKSIAELNVNMQALIISELLLYLGKRKDVKDLPIVLNQFLVLLESAKNKNIKELIDDHLIENWKKLTAHSITKSSDRLIKLVLKKKVIKDDEEYYRGVILTSPLLDHIENDDTEVTLRGKDKRVFKILINYILKTLSQEENYIVSASNNKISPTFMAIVKGYELMVHRANDLLDKLAFIDEGALDAKIEILYDKKDLDFSKYEKDLAILPEVTEDGFQEVDTSMMNQNVSLTQHTIDYNTQTNIPTVPDSAVGYNDSSSDEMTEDELRKLLYGGQPQPNMPVACVPNMQMNTMAQQQVVMPKPVAMAQPMMGQSMMGQPMNPVMPQQMGMQMQNMNQVVVDNFGNPIINPQTGRPMTQQEMMAYQQQNGIPFPGPYTNQYR